MTATAIQDYHSCGLLMLQDVVIFSKQSCQKVYLLVKYIGCSGFEVEDICNQCSIGNLACAKEMIDVVEEAVEWVAYIATMLYMRIPVITQHIVE